MTKDHSTVQSLVGEELSEVGFVRDYVELHFDGPVLRCLTKPVVESPSGRFVFPESGSRDALCSVIGGTVTAVSVQEHISIALEFSGGQKITVPLDDASRVGPEAAHYQS